MKALTILAAIALSTPIKKSIAADAAGFDAYYDVAKVAAVGNTQNSITRQSSVAIQLKNFSFSEVQQGNFVPELTISFRSALPGGGFDEAAKITILFSQVIKNIDKDKQVTLNLSNQMLASGINLSRITHAHVDLRLHKVKDSFNDFASVISPILNTVVPTASPSIAVLEKALTKVQEGADAPILFSADFLVAANYLEYQALESSFGSAFLKNNQEYLISISATTPVTDTSIKGKLATLVNQGARAVIGNQVIDTNSENIKGYASIVFSKDFIALLPNDLEQHLRAISNALRKPTFDSVLFEATANTAESTNAYLDSVRAIDLKTASTITEYISLARVYAAYRSATGSSQSPWSDGFADWLFGFKVRAPSLAAQSIGVKGIYSPNNGKALLAPIYVPYFLPEDLLLQAQYWQLQLHRSLAAKANTVAALEDGIGSMATARK